MDRTNRFLVALVTLFGLVALFAYQCNSPAGKEVLQPLDFDVEDVVGFEIQNRNGRFVFTRQDGVWWLARPVQHPADHRKIVVLLANLSAIRTTRPLPEGTTPATDLHAAGLDRDVARFVVRMADGKRQGVLGKPPAVGSRTFMAVDGRQGVFSLVSTVARLFHRDLDDYRDPRRSRK